MCVLYLYSKIAIEKKEIKDCVGSMLQDDRWWSLYPIFTPCTVLLPDCTKAVYVIHRIWEKLQEVTFKFHNKKTMGSGWSSWPLEALSFSVDLSQSLTLWEPRLWTALLRGPHGEEPEPPLNSNVSELKRTSHHTPQPWPTAWPQSLERPWATNTQLSHFRIPDPPKLCKIINVLCF